MFLVPTGADAAGLLGAMYLGKLVGAGRGGSDDDWLAHDTQDEEGFCETTVDDALCSVVTAVVGPWLLMVGSTVVEGSSELSVLVEAAVCVDEGGKRYSDVVLVAVSVAFATDVDSGSSVVDDSVDDAVASGAAHVVVLSAALVDWLDKSLELVALVTGIVVGSEPEPVVREPVAVSRLVVLVTGASATVLAVVVFSRLEVRGSDGLVAVDGILSVVLSVESDESCVADGVCVSSDERSGISPSDSVGLAVAGGVYAAEELAEINVSVAVSLTEELTDDGTANLVLAVGAVPVGETAIGGGTVGSVRELVETAVGSDR